MPKFRICYDGSIHEEEEFTSDDKDYEEYNLPNNLIDYIVEYCVSTAVVKILERIKGRKNGREKRCST